MKELDLDLQGGIDYVGNRIKEAIDLFVADKAALPSWGPELDAQVQAYVAGLGDWMVGNLVWSFETERYFSKEGHTVKKTRQIALLPQRVSA